MDEPHVIAMVGAKGGCGTTLLAANLAAGLGEGRPACAVDLDFSRGDLAGLLDLEADCPLPELLHPRVDATYMRGSACHHPDGFSVLGQPRDLSRLAHPCREDVARLIRAAAAAWDVVVLDVGSRLDPELMGAVSEADQILLVASRDLLAIRNVIRLRALLQRVHGVPRSRLRVVLNNLPTRRAGDELAEVADLDVIARVRADERAAELAVATGRIVRVAAPRSVLAQDLDSLWRAVAGAEPITHSWHLPWTGGPQ